MIAEAGLFVTPEVAAHVLWWNRWGGYPPGGFGAALLEAFSHADHENTALLSTAYPALGKALKMGRPELENIFKGAAA